MMELDLSTLTALRVLGRGATGTVFLVTDSSNPSVPPFALKVIPKKGIHVKDVESSSSLRRAQWELSLLSRLSHPFLPHLLGSLDSPSLLAYALPFCPGGDLNSLRHSLADDYTFSHSSLRFYLSEILAALHHLHSLHIVYRDLKPENILIQSTGHLTLTDFDLSRTLYPTTTTPFSPITTANPSIPNRGGNALTNCAIKHHHHRSAHGGRQSLTRVVTDNIRAGLTKAKSARVSARVSPVGRRRSASSRAASSGVEKANSFVGTEEYVAPEIVRGEGHDYAVDFWALGILAYEMAYGKTPFKGKNRKETFRNVLMKNVEFVGRQRTDLTDLIRRLLVKDPSRRLGSAGGAEEVKDHPFFRGVRWDMLTEVSRPPYLATAEELEEAVRAPDGDGKGFRIMDYFESSPTSPEVCSSPLETLSEF